MSFVPPKFPDPPPRVETDMFEQLELPGLLIPSNDIALQGKRVHFSDGDVWYENMFYFNPIKHCFLDVCQKRRYMLMVWGKNLRCGGTLKSYINLNLPFNSRNYEDLSKWGLAYTRGRT